MSSELAKKVKHIITEYKFGDFFRNLIAVALGIIITFVGSDLITERKTQKKYMLTNHNLQDAWTFYLQVTEGYGLVNQITRIIDANEFLHHIKDIDETIAAIEKEYN